jgi:transposase
MAKQNADTQASEQGASASGSTDTPTPQASGAGRRYSEPFKADAVRLVTHERYTIAQAAAAVGVSEKSLRDWHRHRMQSTSTSQASNDDASMAAENRRLREQLRQVEMERDILKKAARVFADDANIDSPSSKGKR